MFYIPRFFIALIISIGFLSLGHSVKAQGYGVSGLTGRAVSWRSGKVSTQIPGLVKSFHVKIGDRVKQGDILAVIDSVILTSNMHKAQSELEEAMAKSSVAKARMALKQDIMSRQNRLRKTAAFQRARYDEARLAFQIAKAEYVATKSRIKIQQTIVDRKKLDIKLSVIRAPYDGVIKKIFTQKGAFITPEDPTIVAMIDSQSHEIEVDIAVQDTQHYQQGAIVSFKHSNGNSFQARVRSLLPNINIRTQTRPVRFTPLDKVIMENLVIGQEVTLIQPQN